MFILKTFEHFEKIQVKDIRDYQFYQPPPINKNTVLDEVVDEEEDKTFKEYKELKLTFCREPNESTKINYVPLIYQESQNLENNKFMIYDINKERFEVTHTNNPAL